MSWHRKHHVVYIAFLIYIGGQGECISQGSPEKQNQQEIDRDIEERERERERKNYFKVLAHLIMEAWQVQNLMG